MIYKYTKHESTSNISVDFNKVNAPSWTTQGKLINNTQYSSKPDNAGKDIAVPGSTSSDSALTDFVVNILNVDFNGVDISNETVGTTIGELKAINNAGDLMVVIKYLLQQLQTNSKSIAGKFIPKQNVVYSGKSQSIGTFELKDPNATISVLVSDKQVTLDDKKSVNVTDAGTYTISYTIEPKDTITYNTISDTIKVTLQKASPISTPPVLKTNIVANGAAQTLVDPPSDIHGTIEYKVGSGNWSTEIPTKTEPGSYEISYRVTPSDRNNYKVINETDLGAVIISEKKNVIGYVAFIQGKINDSLNNLKEDDFKLQLYEDETKIMCDSGQIPNIDKQSMYAFIVTTKTNAPIVGGWSKSFNSPITQNPYILSNKTISINGTTYKIYRPEYSTGVVGGTDWKFVTFKL